MVQADTPRPQLGSYQLDALLFPPQFIIPILSFIGMERNNLVNTISEARGAGHAQADL